MNLLFKKIFPLVLIACFLIASRAERLQAATPIQESYHRSFSYEKVQDYDNAIKALMPIFQTYPKGYTVNYRLGWLYYLKQSYSNALSHYGQAISVAPYSIEVKLGITLPLMAQLRWEDVENQLYKVVKTDFYNYYGNLRLAYVLRQQKKVTLGIQVMQKMLSLYPTDVSCLTELALLYVEKKDKKAAGEVFQTILTLDRENVAAKSFFAE